MRHWSQLATRNWQVKRVRTAGALLAIALGVGAVVWVSCVYESVRRTVMDWAFDYVGRSHVTIESPLGRYSQFALRKVREVTELEEVKHATPLLLQRLRGKVQRQSEYVEGARYDTWVHPEVDYHGIDLEHEFYLRDHELAAGRMLRPDDQYACVLEAAYAREEGVGVGDYLIMWDETGQSQYALEIVGLVNRRRIARFQPPTALLRLPVLQEINNKFGFVTALDVVLDDGSQTGVLKAATKIHRIIRKNRANAHVRSAMARMRQVAYAQQQQEVVLGLLSCVAMLTALFIILSTLSMGMMERISQLGLLRCIGTTRWQLALLVFLEVIPLGALGILLGIPFGLGLTALSVALVPEYVGDFTISWRGILLAAAAGLATTVLAAVLPALGAARVSPLDASRPRARAARRSPVIVAFVLGGLLLAAQVFVVTQLVRRDFEFVRWSATSVVLLYLFYALAAPLAVWLLGSPAVVVVARIMGVRTRLLQDQVGCAVWRSAGICCGLMVGLSLIVALVVLNHSFRAGWEFPKQFPEAYIWSYDQLGIDTAEAARRVAKFPAVKEFTLANAPNVVVEESPNSAHARALRSITWFLGIDPDTFFDLVKLEFVEGDELTARELLKQGGYVLIAADFARTRHKGMHADEEKGISNQVRVWFSNRGRRDFRVAGVVDSPALDIAASFFQIQTEARVAAVGSVIGTNADLKRYFNIDGVKLVLLNLDLPPEDPPAGWPPPRDPSAAGLADSYYDENVPLQRRWRRYRTEGQLREIRLALDATQAYTGTASELKDQIDSELTNLTYLLTAVPAVALLVAAIGVANLMTANVASRARQLAILRAVGATRGQILRMVVGEALVLGLLGTGLGLLLGLHLAWDVSAMTVRFWGFKSPFLIPWTFVGMAIAVTVGLCILAGILPARHASRTNVIDALHVA